MRKLDIFHGCHKFMVANNTEITEKVRMVERPKDAAKFSEEFEETIRTNKNIIVWLAYQQGIIFQRFKGKEFGFSRSTISFKIAIIGLINYYPKMKNYLRCLYIF